MENVTSHDIALRNMRLQALDEFYRQQVRSMRLAGVQLDTYFAGHTLIDFRINFQQCDAEFMGKGLSNWIVHFASCAPFRIEKRRIYGFMENTNVLMAIGHRKSPYWMEGSAVDLLLLDDLQYYKDMRKL